MRILVKKDEGWVQVERQNFADEGLLETLIQESPEVIPPESGVDLVVYARQFSCPPGYAIDLVGVGSDGGISVVECKLARNRESKRQVVGQILEYAAGLWGMGPDDFESRFIDADGRLRQQPGRSPFTLLETGGMTDANLLADCRAQVAENLKAGRFRLLIAVDDFSPELKSIIRYVNAHSGGQLTLVALALPEFSDGTTRVLIPETYGNEAAPPPTAGAAEPVPPDDQIAAAKPAWREALKKMHAFLAEPLIAIPRSKSILYYSSADDPKPLLVVWPTDGRLSPGVSREQFGFDGLMEASRELGMNVGKESIRFADAAEDKLDLFMEHLRVFLALDR